MAAAPKGAARGAKQKSQQTDSTSSRLLQLDTIPDGFAVELPVENLRRRPMRREERSLVVSCWWRMRREGVRLLPEPNVIVIEGGRP